MLQHISFVSRLLHNSCYALYLDQGVFWQSLDCDGATGWERCSEELRIDCVHLCEIPHVGKEDGGLQDLIHG